MTFASWWNTLPWNPRQAAKKLTLPEGKSQAEEIADTLEEILEATLESDKTVGYREPAGILPEEKKIPLLKFVDQDSCCATHAESHSKKTRKAIYEWISLSRWKFYGTHNNIMSATLHYTDQGTWLVRGNETSSYDTDFFFATRHEGLSEEGQRTLLVSKAHALEEDWYTDALIEKFEEIFNTRKTITL